MFTFKDVFHGTILLGLAGGLVCMAPAQTANSSSGSNAAQMTQSEKVFVKKAAEGGIAEVEMGKLATEKAASPEVKQFGQRMVDDHSKANDQLKQVAENQGITLPTQPSAAEKAEKAKLSKLSGQQFDKAYMATMLKDHKEDIAEFRHESRSGKDAAVRNFAQQTLPTLESHLKEAESIAPKEGVQTSSARQQPAPMTK
jgi:putative membrane protein